MPSALGHKRSVFLYGGRLDTINASGLLATTGLSLNNLFIWIIMLTTFLVHGQVLPVALRSHTRGVINPIFLSLHTI